MRFPLLVLGAILTTVAVAIATSYLLADFDVLVRNTTSTSIGLFFGWGVYKRGPTLFEGVAKGFDKIGGGPPGPTPA